LNLVLAALGALVVAAGTGFAAQRLEFAPIPTERLLSYCRRLLLPHVTPGGVAALGLVLLGLVVIGRGARSAVSQLRGCRRFLCALDVLGERDFGGKRAVVVSGSCPQAFCMGFARPRVLISLGACEVLTEPQLQAVVAHEAHHARRRDPLRILLATVFGEALFFLPAVRRLRERYAELAEVAADEAALAVVGDPSPLAAALLRFGDHGAPGIVGISPERVDHLLGAPPGWRLPASVLAGATTTVLALAAFVLATFEWLAPGRASLPLLAARSCMLVMLLAPLLMLAGVTIARRRTIASRRS